MLELHTGQTGEKIIVTLTELATLPAPNYLFVFIHILTKDTVAFVAGPDESELPYRYNQFTVDTSLFEQDGFWNYTAYEQVSAANIDPALAFAIVEYGKLIVYPATEFAPTAYNQPTTYQSYEG